VKKNIFGFTLVEILVVVTIIGIISSLGLVAFASTRKTARDSKRKADLEQIRSALELYRSDVKTYPNATFACGASIAYGGTTYMSSFPCDLVTGYQYIYSYQNANQYNLCAKLENTAAGTLCSSGACRVVDGGQCNYQVTQP